ncbi:cell cycle checkpoint protein [Grosmannia clavigera kw1407]|uniref:Cell cycle checkpoint protein n=1 Tax=Grosmannia clavigera (strain kw1407 / UAMH 11150) TaxID=655863 RepID=F0XD01_GROCL|nr:cell cycle checkpoint protein [Grosmannia clavigera kw1407]EFX04752.1 cell cycle checkpoint protein [Grosmannia clavigera kw1407]
MICYVPVGVRTPDGEIESWSALPCGHRFGSYCVKRWLGLAEQPACPICRTPMVHACGHPVLPLPTVPSKTMNGKAEEDGYSDSENRLSKKAALMSQNASPASHTSSPAAGSPDGSTLSRSVSRFRRKRRLSVPGSSSIPVRVPLDTQAPCEYCSVSLVKQQSHGGPPGGVVRLAFRVFTQHSRSNNNNQSNTENAYWERWRKDNSRAFGEWWATQQPPTEPARELPTQELAAVLNSLDKIVWMRLDNDTVQFIVVPDKGSEVWSTFRREFLFDNYLVQSLDAGNRIDLELPLASLQRALKSALNSTDAVLRLSKHDGVPVLSMTIHTMANPRGGLGGFGGGGSSGSGAGGATSGRRPGNYGRENTFGDSIFVDQGTQGTQQRTQADEETLELTVKREREKVVVQDIPVRVLRLDGEHRTLEPTVAEADVNIVLPPLMQLKAVSDRFTKLAHTTSGGSFSGSANMYGTLRLRLVTDTLSVETVWNDLENPPMNEEALPMPLAEHPSTKFLEAGPDKFATVLVDGRDWSRVLSVGRLDGRVIACFNDTKTLVLHVYVSQPDDADDATETSSITYYVTSYST